MIKDITERKKAEEALRDSEEKYRGLFDESIATVYVFDEKKNFIDSNLAGLDLLGYTKAELLTMSIPDVDADPNIVLSAHEQLLSGERLVNYEHKLKRKDGRIITVLNNSRPLVDLDGKVVGMQSTLIDISERKRAEEMLTKSEEKYSTVVENSLDAIIIHQEGVIRFVNSATAHLTGYRVEDFIGKSIMDYIVPEHRDRVAKNYADRLAGKDVPNIYEIELIKKDGSTFPVEINATIIDYMGKPSTLVYLRDITERKKAENEVQRSKEFLDRVIDGSADAIVTTDSNGNVTTWSRGAEALYGFSAEEVLGKPVHILYPKEFSDERRKWQKKITAGQTLYNIETKVYIKEGELRDISLSLSPLKDGEGRIVGTVGVSKDITEIKRINAEMRKKVRELEKWYNLTVDRELKMVELKKKIKELEAEIERVRGGG